MRTTLGAGRNYISWVKAYLECLFDGRDVVVLEKYKHQLELTLERP